MNAPGKNHPRVALKVVPAPGIGHVINAPPALIVSTHSTDFTCGKCRVSLMHAESGQVHNLLIRCTECGSYNSTDI
jgi:hypothetical protein